MIRHKNRSSCSDIDTDHVREVRPSASTAGVPRKQLTGQMRPLDVQDPPYFRDVYDCGAVLGPFCTCSVLYILQLLRTWR
jgi:hypothetical protein